MSEAFSSKGDVSPVAPRSMPFADDSVIGTDRRLVPPTLRIAGFKPLEPETVRPVGPVSSMPPLNVSVVAGSMVIGPAPSAPPFVMTSAPALMPKPPVVVFARAMVSVFVPALTILSAPVT